MLELSYKKIFLVALPLMFGTFIQSIIGITDGAFVNQLGTIAYDAVGNGSILYTALYMLSRGLADGTQILIARKYGENKLHEIGNTLFSAQIVQLILSALIFAFFLFLSEPIILNIAKSREIGEAMTEFMHYRGWGIFFAGLMVTMNAFFIGLGKTRIIIWSTLILACSNIILDYGLIYGKLGMPELGMKGAAIASSLAELLAFLFLFVAALKWSAYKDFNYHLRHRLHRVRILNLIKLSVPIMFQGLVSLSTWLIFFTMIEHLGPENLEVAHNIRYMYFLAFIPVFGFAGATRTYVSNLVGRSEEEKIPGVQVKIILLSVASLVVLFHGAVLYPEWLIGIVEHSGDAQIMADSVDTLRFVSGSILIVAIISIPFHSVSALGKSVAFFLIELISIIIYLIACYYVIVKWDWSIVEVWWVEYLYFGSLGLFSILFLLWYFKKKRYLREREKVTMTGDF